MEYTDFEGDGLSGDFLTQAWDFLEDLGGFCFLLIGRGNLEEAHRRAVRVDALRPLDQPTQKEKKVSHDYTPFQQEKSSHEDRVILYTVASFSRTPQHSQLPRRSHSASFATAISQKETWCRFLYCVCTSIARV